MKRQTWVALLLWISILCKCEVLSGLSKIGLHTSSTLTRSSTDTSESLLSENFPKTSTGTTIVGLCCRDGVILGSDTRSTGGKVVMDKNVLKIHYIAPSIRCCAAGTSADCEFLSNEAKMAVTLADIDAEMAGDILGLGKVKLAVESIMASLTRKIEDRGRIPSAVFIVGGMDKDGAQLFQIEADGTPQRLPFAALGSGSLDALSILENECRKFSLDRNKRFLDISVEDGLKIVRKAVQAGILNDLGSGSHVDLCCIEGSRGKVRQWREEMVNRWPKPSLSTNQFLAVKKEEENEDEAKTVIEDDMDATDKRLGKKWLPGRASLFRCLTMDSSSYPPSQILQWDDNNGLILSDCSNAHDTNELINVMHHREFSVDIL